MYKIRDFNYDALVAEIEKLNKRATKLGVKPAVLTVCGEVTEEIKNIFGHVFGTKTYKLVTVEGETPKLDGWKLLAVVELLASGENLVRTVPGQTVAAEYRTAAPTCDHCKVNRQRKETFIVQHEDGRTAQVGRTCLADFLGGKSPDSIVAWAELEIGLGELCQSAEADGFGSSRGVNAWGMDEFLTTTATVIRRLGWTSRAVATDSGREATASTVGFLLAPAYSATEAADKRDFIKTHDLHTLECDSKLAAEALAWGVNLPTTDGDYVYNLGVACRLGYVTYKTSGLVASLIAAYKRHLDRAEELRVSREAKIRGHVGTVGQREGFAGLTVKAIRRFDSMYGTRAMVRFEDATGNVLVWWTADTDLTEGERLDVTGTVKSHEDYNGTPQTILTRVAKGLPKAKGKKKLAS